MTGRRENAGIDVIIRGRIQIKLSGEIHAKPHGEGLKAIRMALESIDRANDGSLFLIRNQIRN